MDRIGPLWRSGQGHEDGVRVLDVPPMQYLMVDGQGDPNTGGDYADAIGVLFPLSYKPTSTTRSI